MANKNFKNLIDNECGIIEESNHIDVQIVNPVTTDHPIVSEILSIKDDDKRKQIMADITNLIGELEVGRVLLREATKGIQTYTDSINKANIDLQINIDQARTVVADYEQQLEDVKTATFIIKLEDYQEKWLEDNRIKYIDATDKAFVALHKAIGKLGAEQISRYKEELKKYKPGNVISDVVFMTAIAIFFVLHAGFWATAFIALELHSEKLMWLLWIEGVLIALIIGISIFAKRRNPNRY